MSAPASLLDLRGRVVIVTGGAKGIGEGIVRAFAEEGAIPVIMGRSPEAGDKVVAEIRAAGNAASFVEVELTREEELRAAVGFPEYDALLERYAS